MKLTDEKAMSEWAYWQCFKGNDTPEMRDLIIDSGDAYCYCVHIRDIKEMWSKIKDPSWAEWYCSCINDRPEVRRYIKNEINR